MDKKQKQLGINPGTARNKLVKLLLFDMANKLNQLNCFQCGKKIKNIDDFTIEHKIPWLDSNNPKELFFNLDNIAFSHKVCNIKAARKNKKSKGQCSSCKKIKSESEFYKNKSKVRGYEDECKECKKKRTSSKKYRARRRKNYKNLNNESF